MVYGWLEWGGEGLGGGEEEYSIRELSRTSPSGDDQLQCTSKRDRLPDEILWSPIGNGTTCEAYYYALLPVGVGGEESSESSESSEIGLWYMCGRVSESMRSPMSEPGRVAGAGEGPEGANW